MGKNPTMSLDITHDHVAECTIVECVSTFLRNALQRLRIVAAYELLSWARWPSIGQEARAAGWKACQVLLTTLDNIDQILTGGKPARRIADGRLQDGLQVEAPITGFKIAPALERPRNSNRQIADTVFLPYGFEVVRPGVRDRCIHVRRGGSWRHGIVVDYHTVAGAGIIEID